MSAHEKNIFTYFINLDERGEFYADVRDENSNTIINIKGFEIFEDGWMRNKTDIKGLKSYLISLGLIKIHDCLIS